jgi:hypothetical protein
VSTNIHIKDVKMPEKLEGLVLPALEAVGYPHGWGRAMADRLGAEVPDDLGRLTLTQEAIDDVGNCGGLWQGKDVVSPLPSSAFTLRRELVTRVTKEWVESAMVWGQSKPMDFVREFLRRDANFDPLTAAMLHLATDFERAELEGELAMAIAHLAESWPAVVDGTQITLGPVVEELTVGGVVLKVDTVDLTYGDHRLGVEVNWPGAVLVRLVPHFPSPSELEEMALGALVHTIATGCPPQRLVVYGLQSGRGIGMDVERDWLEVALAGTQLAVKAIAAMRNDRGMVIHGGDHCIFCPYRDNCEMSEADEAPF